MTEVLPEPRARENTTCVHTTPGCSRALSSGEVAVDRGRLLGVEVTFS